MLELSKKRIQLIIFSFRIILIFSIWLISRLSYVFDISTELRLDIFGSRSLILGIIIIIFKITVLVMIELILGLEINEESQLSFNQALSNRNISNNFIYANGTMFFAELLLVINLILELANLRSINFVRIIMSSGSLLGVIMNPSGYIIFWGVLIIYSISIFMYLILNDKDDSKKLTRNILLLLCLKLHTFDINQG